jgi:methyl-accepting chemotaxis protein
VIVLGTAISGCVLMVIAGSREAVSWLGPAGVLWALIWAGCYVMTVVLPQRRLHLEILARDRRREAHLASLGSSLEELRHGDLVGAQAPIRELSPEVRHAVEAAARSLAGLVQQIQSSSVEVATAASIVQETASDLASGSSQQAAAVVQITATMEELARTAGQIAVNAAGQAELAAKSEQAGNDGAAAVEAAVAGVEAVRERMEAIARRADTLGSRSREIYRVLDLIVEIAQETHILSLNAAIEAAAAGEHGERFSVVADEVRRLAERSRESTDSVRSLLDEFSGAIRSMVVATEEGSKSAEQVLQRSRSTEMSIEQLSSALADTARTAREISLATQEQRTASDQVVQTLKEVSEVIQRMADGLKQFSGTAERLNQLALSIQLLTQSFRIDSVHSLKHLILTWAARLTDYTGNLEAAEGCLGDVIKACPFLELVYLVDRGGTMVAFMVNRDLVGHRDLPGSVGIGQGYAERPWFQAVSRDHRTAVTPLYESLMTGDQCFTVAAAVHDLDGVMVGMLGFDVNVRNWTRI